MKQNNKVFIAAVLIVAVLFSFIPLTGGFGNAQISYAEQQTEMSYIPEFELPDIPVGDEILYSGSCGDGLTWTLDNEGTLIISGDGNMVDCEYYYGYQEYGGYSYSADTSKPSPFYPYRDKIKSLIISDGVDSIGSFAFFKCNALETVSISDTVSIIENAAFTECGNIKYMKIPFLGRTANEAGGIAHLVDTGIRFGANLPHITTLIVSGGKLNDNTIYGDNPYSSGFIDNLVIGKNVTYISPNAFAYKPSSEFDLTNAIFTRVKAVKIESDALAENVVFNACGALCYAEFTGKLSAIAERAFSGCWSLETLLLPDDVAFIGDSAFEECTALTSVDIPDSVTSIGECAFRVCEALTSVNIPDSVTTIGDAAFSYCTALTSVNIPDSVTSIGDWVFSACYLLTSVDIPDSVTTIGYEAFYGCRSLTSVNIPDSVTSIGEYAFCGCEALTSVNIPDSVTSIGYRAFSGCTALEKVTIENPDCVLPRNEYFMPYDTVICGKHDSTALEYAENFDRDFVFIDEHTYTEGFTLPATCAAYGYKTLVCSCGDTKNELIEPVGHKDENEDGKCDFCKMNMTAVCDHDFALDYTPATCTADGEIRMTCTLCKKTSTKAIPATGHNYVDFVIEPTCTSDGYTKHYCINCGDELRDTPVKALGHAMRTQTITPTCTEQGCDIMICDNCGYNYEANVVAAAGHKVMLVNAIEADKYTDGYTGDIVCSVCNALLEAGEVIPAQSEGGEDTPQVKCSHLCHKSGILGFFWKLINLFNKLFKINQFCECGAAHW